MRHTHCQDVGWVAPEWVYQVTLMSPYIVREPMGSHGEPIKEPMGEPMGEPTATESACTTCGEKFLRHPVLPLHVKWSSISHTAPSSKEWRRRHNGSWRVMICHGPVPVRLEPSATIIMSIMIIMTFIIIIITIIKVIMMIILSLLSIIIKVTIVIIMNMNGNYYHYYLWLWLSIIIMIIIIIMMFLWCSYVETLAWHGLTLSCWYCQEQHWLYACILGICIALLVLEAARDRTWPVFHSWYTTAYHSIASYLETFRNTLQAKASKKSICWKAFTASAHSFLIFLAQCCAFSLLSDLLCTAFVAR